LLVVVAAELLMVAEVEVVVELIQIFQVSFLLQEREPQFLCLLGHIQLLLDREVREELHPQTQEDQVLPEEIVHLAP
jgi:general stress protein 26